MKMTNAGVLCFLALVSGSAWSADVNVSIYQSSNKLQGIREIYEQNPAATVEAIQQVSDQTSLDLVIGQTLQLTPKLMTDPSSPVDLTGYEGIDWVSNTPWLIRVSESGLVTAGRSANYDDNGSGIESTGKGIITLTYRASNGDIGYNEVQINVLPNSSSAAAGQARKAASPQSN